MRFLFFIYLLMTMQLTYFTVRGRVEPVRLMLEATGHPYTFNGIEFGIEEWKAQKNDTPTPFGALPYIEIVNEDGTSAIFSQSLAIARYSFKLCQLTLTQTCLPYHKVGRL